VFEFELAAFSSSDMNSFSSDMAISIFVDRTPPIY